jgi:hypothetical protein
MCHRFERLGDGQHLRTQRYAVTDEAVGISGSVESFVVRADDPARVGFESDRRQQTLADRRVPPKSPAFGWDQIAREAHLLPIEEQLAHIVKARRVVEVDHVGLGHLERPSDRVRSRGNASPVTFAPGLCFDRCEERLEDHASGASDLAAHPLELLSPCSIGGAFGAIQAAQRLIGCTNCFRKDGANATFYISVSHVGHAKRRRSRG